jgi:hypothetical protein
LPVAIGDGSRQQPHRLGDHGHRQYRKRPSSFAYPMS